MHGSRSVALDIEKLSKSTYRKYIMVIPLPAPVE